MRSFLFSICSWLLIAAGVFLAVRGGLDYWDSRRGQSEIASQWDKDQEAGLKAQTADSAESERVIPARSTNKSQQNFPGTKRGEPGTKLGETVARLSIPRLSTVLYVVEGTDDRDLKRGPGHMEGSAMPGQDGNCVIAGHRDTHFSVLKNIRKGDEILIDRAGKKFLYKVDEMSIVTPDNTESLRPTRRAELNLITCFPFQYVGPAPRRFVVRATLESPAV